MPFNTPRTTAPDSDDDWSSVPSTIPNGSSDVLSTIPTIPHAGVYSFGVEIEIVALPKTIYDSSNQREFLNNDFGYWRQRLADALNRKEVYTDRFLRAVASRPSGSYEGKWHIVHDGSLRVTNYEVALEAVSPIMDRPYYDLKFQIDPFWKVTRKIFNIQKNTSCGAHIHVGLSGRDPNRRYQLAELMKVAYAVATQEKFILQILPQERVDNDYCRPSSFRSEELKLDLEDEPDIHSEWPFSRIAKALLRMKNREALIEYMQAGSRYVLWNFKNVVGRSGTVEFRGGRHLRGPVRTKRWIAFTVSFVAKAIEDDWIYKMDAETDIDDWWQSIRFSAIDLDMDGFLPSRWQSMRDFRWNS
ncbi:MAG: hypothetical protein M1812_005212 [Candelaria pacifica]|nr:MAG: hypothetical protein M1812_005212 [Candelaria pacifica]